MKMLLASSVLLTLGVAARGQECSETAYEKALEQEVSRADPEGALESYEEILQAFEAAAGTAAKAPPWPRRSAKSCTPRARRPTRRSGTRRSPPSKRRTRQAA